MPYNITNTTHQLGQGSTIHADLGRGERLVLPAHTSQVLLRHELPVSLRVLQQKGELTITFLPGITLALTLLAQQTARVSAAPPTKKKVIKAIVVPVETPPTEVE